MKRLRYPLIAVAIVSFFLVSSQTAYAAIDAGIFDQAARSYYIDPGTGSIVIQVLIGALVAGVAMMGVYRMRVKMFFSNLFGGRKTQKEGGESEDSGERE